MEKLIQKNNAVSDENTADVGCSSCVHHEPNEPFLTPCCGVAIAGDIVFGETLCPYCESSFQSEDACKNPCDPANPCDSCEAYWNKMRQEGLWQDGVGWSDAALRSMR